MPEEAMTPNHQPPAQIALIGLAVMGQNLVLNMIDHGARVAVYNRSGAVTDAFLAGSGADAARAGTLVGVATLPELVAALERPRQLMLMVKAGAPVDAVIDALIPLLEPGDVVIDGGNSHFADSRRRAERLAQHGLHFLGVGVSGGEEGARFGPSIMPGGPRDAYERVRPLFEAIAAQVDGTPCCAWMGEGGAGHFVKMVHNGIEYGDMQLIAEAYHLMRDALGMDAAAMRDTFARWNEGVLDSFLIEVTRDVLGTVDDEGRLVLDLILDRAGQKGTGRWTAAAALEQGQPLSLITEAVFARSLSAMKDLRVRSSTLPGPDARFDGDRTGFLADLEQALYAAKIVSYTQGYLLLRDAVAQYGWSTDLATTARIWRGGCIIRSRFLDDITAAFAADPSLPHLLLAPFFASALARAHEAWRRVVAEAVRLGIALPAMASGLAFYDGLRTADGPANLIQAQRDYFGAHTYERVDRPRGESFHTDWIGSGGAVTAGSYEG
jgi:6-phosphogluconate dehydrogenase